MRQSGVELNPHSQIRIGSFSYNDGFADSTDIQSPDMDLDVCMVEDWIIPLVVRPNS